MYLFFVHTNELMPNITLQCLGFWGNHIWNIFPFQNIYICCILCNDCVEFQGRDVKVLKFMPFQPLLPWIALLDWQICAPMFIGFIFSSGNAGTKGCPFKVVIHIAKLITRLIIQPYAPANSCCFPTPASTAFQHGAHLGCAGVSFPTRFSARLCGESPAPGPAINAVKWGSRTVK